MTVYGINSTDKDPIVGWESVKPKFHPKDERVVRSEEAYHLASKMVDDLVDWETIQEVSDLGAEFDYLARMDYACACVVPEQSCRLCKATSALVYYKQEYGNGK